MVNQEKSVKKHADHGTIENNTRNSFKVWLRKKGIQRVNGVKNTRNDSEVKPNETLEFVDHPITDPYSYIFEFSALLSHQHIATINGVQVTIGDKAIPDFSEFRFDTSKNTFEIEYFFNQPKLGIHINGNIGHPVGGD